MTHYNKKYWNWQKQVGGPGGYLNKFKFESFIKPNDILMDFGCGGGFLLDNFKNSKKLGFEINSFAKENCKKLGINVYDNFDDIPDNYIDIIISNHAFEHIPNPLSIFKQLLKKLKKNGKIVIVVPYEQGHEESSKYKENDINQHLYTWCPQSFGNLAKLAGFKIIKCETIQHQWCPGYQNDYKQPNFHKRCKELAVKNKNYQVRLIATKLS